MHVCAFTDRPRQHRDPQSSILIESGNTPCRRDAEQCMVIMVSMFIDDPTLDLSEHDGVKYAHALRGQTFSTTQPIARGF